MKKVSIFSRFRDNESGATAIEYGLIAALIGVGMITGAKAFADSLNGMFSSVDSKLVEAFDSSNADPSGTNPEPNTDMPNP